MSKYARRRDANHSIIVSHFKQLGAAVMDLSDAGQGRPDVFVHRAGVWYPVEIKTAKGTLTAAQKDFMQWCEMNSIKYYVVRDIADVMKVLDVTAF